MKTDRVDEEILKKLTGLNREQAIDLWQRESGYNFHRWKKACHEHDAKVLRSKGYGPEGAKEPILFNGKLGWITVLCEKCGIDYDIRDVDNETTHPAALHVARFDCPKGHRCEARRVWNSYDDFLKACGIEAPMEQQIGPARPASEGVKAPTRQADQRAERIIVVDDEEGIRKTICSMLASAGYQCRAVAGGLEALALLESGEEFELLLCDLLNAPLDGISLLERTKERFPDIPVVVATAVRDDSVALACIQSGAYDYLLKPFERGQLLGVVRRALEHRRLKLENRRLEAREKRWKAPGSL